MIAVIDYGAGNIQSVIKAMNYIGSECVVTNSKEKIISCDGAILPGVGSFEDAMNCMKESGSDEAVIEFTRTGKPFLGICLGLQLLFESSEESPGVEGLGILDGHILRIPDGEGRKVPQIGWNDLRFPNPGRLFEGIPEGAFVYFVHSYYLRAQDPSIVTGTAQYGVKIDASVESGNVFACQFHPEKSESVGMKILGNFLAI